MNFVAKKNAFDYINIIFLSLLALSMLYPLYYVVSLSFSDRTSINQGIAYFYPGGFNTNAYTYLLLNDTIPRAFLNSVFYSVSATVVYLLANSLVAYPLTIKRFKLNKYVTIYYLITMFVGGGMIPTYLLFVQLGLIDNVLVMIIPSALSVYTIMIFRTNFMTLGTELTEAAYIDGANDFYVLFRIIMPLSKPILVTFALFSIVGKWNDFFTPLLYLDDSKLYPLTLIMRKLLISLSVQDMERLLMSNQMDSTMKKIWMSGRPHESALRGASIVITILPILFIYPFMQKYFAKGYLLGSLKG